MSEFENTVTIETKLLQKLVNDFNKVCEFCDELNIYERSDLDEDMQKMKKRVEETFGEITE